MPTLLGTRIRSVTYHLPALSTEKVRPRKLTGPLYESLSREVSTLTGTKVSQTSSLDSESRVGGRLDDVRTPPPFFLSVDRRR